MRVISNKIRTARKWHKCALCYLPIPPGWRYVDQRCTDGDTAWRFPMQVECQEALDELRDPWGAGFSKGAVADAAQSPADYPQCAEVVRVLLIDLGAEARARA